MIKVVGRWSKVAVALSTVNKTIMALDCFEFDDGTYCYASSHLRNDEIEKEQDGKTRFQYSDLITIWKNTPMAKCATMVIHPDWTSVECTQEIQTPACECGGKKLNLPHSDWCPLFIKF